MAWFTGPVTKNTIRTVVLAGLIYLSVTRSVQLWMVVTVIALMVVLWLLSAYDEYGRRGR